MNYNLEIDTGILETELTGQIKNVSIEKQGANGNLPWVVASNGFKFQIAEDGKVEAVNGIILSKTNVKLVQNGEETITASLTAGITGNISWRTSNANVATVENGKITAVGSSGTAEITAEVSGTSYSATCTVTIISKVSTISLDKTSLEIEQGGNATIVATPSPATNVEDLVFTSNNANVTIQETGTVGADGKVTNTINVKAEAGENETATITVTGKTTTTVSAVCNITVIKPKGLEIGDYVEYNVTYTDMYSDTDSTTDGLQNYTFSATNGWRVLDPGTKQDGKYTGVKLISTGIPAKLYYYYSSVKSYEKDATGDLGKWAGDSTDRSNYATAFYAPNKQSDTDNPNDYYNMYAASGLYYNFGKILFSRVADPTTNPSSNKGSYVMVNNKTSGDLVENEFKVSGMAEEVHNLTLAELNKARGKTSDLTNLDSVSTNTGDTGLFYLRGLASENSSYGYTSSSNPYYWLASPSAGSTDYLRLVSYNGYISNNYNYTCGVRPVVSLVSEISLEKGADGVWRKTP